MSQVSVGLVVERTKDASIRWVEKGSFPQQQDQRDQQQFGPVWDGEKHLRVLPARSNF